MTLVKLILKVKLILIYLYLLQFVEVCKVSWEKTTCTFILLSKYQLLLSQMDFLGSSDCKESACSAGDPDSMPGLGRSPGEGNGYPF